MKTMIIMAKKVIMNMNKDLNLIVGIGTGLIGYSASLKRSLFFWTEVTMVPGTCVSYLTIERGFGMLDEIAVGVQRIIRIIICHDWKSRSHFSPQQLQPCGELTFSYLYIAHTLYYL